MNRSKKKKHSTLSVVVIWLAMALVVRSCEPGQYVQDDTCVTCEAGYSCSSPSSIPSLCQSGTHSPEGETACLTCTEGYHCPDPAQDAPLSCEDGYYSQSEALRCKACPPGYECTSSTATACQSGYYSLGLNSQCEQCPAGSYCPVTYHEPLICPEGTYSLAGSTTCTTCPAGYKCEVQDQNPVQCADGQYSMEGSTECLNCPVGFYCPTKSELPLPCKSGSYSLGSQTQCTQCTAGSACPDPTTSTSVACTTGQYSPSGSAFCLDCPAGYACTTGTPVKCQDGYYSKHGEATCTQCESGEACVSDGEEPLQCPSGYFSNAGDSTCTICPLGSFCPDTQTKTECTTAGHYCLEGQTESLECPDGYECHTLSSTPLICQSGYYVDDSTKKCTKCPKGYKCSDNTIPVKVAIGYYSPEGVNQEFKCPAGYSCYDSALDLSYSKTPCTSGQYSNEGQGICQNCPIGSACPSPQSSQKIVDCAALPGYYSDEVNLVSCKICPAGYNCPQNEANKLECQAGSYSMAGSSYCLECPPGYECPSTGAVIIKPCLLGTYSPGGLSQCIECPANHSCSNIAAFPCPSYQTANKGDGFCHYFQGSQTGAVIINEIVSYLECESGQFKLFGTLGCIDCPIGHYCPVKYSTPVKCEAGTFQDLEKQTSCKSCDAEYSDAQHYSGFGESQCHLCPAGHYCPNSTSYPRQCQLGFYSEAGWRECQPCQDGHICKFKEKVPNPEYSLCPAGFYCFADLNVDGRLVQKACEAGTYNPLRGQTSSSACLPCPEGYFCPAGSANPRTCTPGSYCIAQTVHNQVYQCPKGQFAIDFNANSAAVCQECPSGHYCPEKGTVVPVKCPVGYWCEESQDAGKLYPCPSGTYSGPFSISTQSECKTCPAGHYCPTASAVPTPCPTGTYNPDTGKQSLSDCIACPARKPCPFYGMTTYQVGLYCAHGFYCPSQTSFPTQYPCMAGTYSDSINITSQNQCLTCPAKYACYEGTNTLTMVKVPCAAGHYCPEGTQYPTQYPCPSGTYGPFTDNESIDQCIVCPEGYYCESGSASPTGLCQKGHYCPLGSKEPKSQPCPSGTYQPIEGAKSKGQCLVCPLGYYCLEASYEPSSCPQGTYGHMAGLKTSLNSSSIDGCQSCPAGYYCPIEAMTKPFPCLAGKYSSSGSTTCTECPFDHYCANITTTAEEMEQSKCDNGFICPAGTAEQPYHQKYSCKAGYFCQNSIQYACPVGTYNPNVGAPSSDYCLEVPAGYYQDEQGAVSYLDKMCPAGYFCPQGSVSAKEHQCPEGTFRNIPGATKEEDCGICPTGYYCPEQSVAPMLCPLGYYCPGAQVYAIPCPIGTFGASYGLREEDDCTPCYAGRYCSQAGLKEPDGLCDPGYYCIQGAFTATPIDGVTGEVCPAGGFCELGSKRPENCPPGTFNPFSGKSSKDDCSPCTPGYYCSGSNNPTETGKCFEGYYCEEGSYIPNQYPAEPGYYTLAGDSAPRECIPGTYNPYSAQSSCIQCPAGYVCATTAMTTLVDCYPGGYCPLGSQQSTPCPSGTYNDQTNGKSLSDCKSCPPGKYCSGTNLTTYTGDCSAGYFCKQGASSSTPSLDSGNNFGPCPKGYYCPIGTGAPLPCPSGTYNPSTGLSSLSQCTQCTAGYYCLSSGLTAVEGKCSKGYYCPQGTKVPKPKDYYCAAGQYCPEGTSSPQTCAAGTYQNQIKQELCLTCPQGYYCPQGSTTFTTNECPQGYYCPESTQTATQYPCPIGTYNPLKKRIALSDCIPCDPGKVCTAAVAQTSVLGPCPAGQYCTLGAPATGTQSVIANFGGTCQAGYYCPEGSAFQIPCPPGKYCATTGLSEPTGECSQGYYCTGGASKSTPTSLTTDKGAICPAGSFCPSGTSYPKPCPAGTYNPSTGKSAFSDCISCQQGYYCPNTTLTSYTSYKCPAGFYCPTGSKTGYENICPVGYKCPQQSATPTACSGNSEYQDEQGQSTCKSCQAGYYCTDSSISKCQPQNDLLSYYCTGTVKTKTLCPDGTYNVKDGSSSSTDCQKCPPGFFCPNSESYPKKINQCPAGYYCLEGTALNYTLCPIGFYCPLGTNVPIPCTAGMYCGTQGLSSPSGNCQAGYYCTHETYYSGSDVGGTKMCSEIVSTSAKTCIRGSTTATQTICPAGSYCPEGSFTKTECPIGTYSSSTGQQTIESCLPCPAGKYCSHRGATQPDDDCSAGFYCPENSTTGTQENYQCQEGYYCPEGVSEMLPCEPGTFQPFKVQDSCLPCPDSYYCNNSATIQPKLCPAGYYCNSASTDPQPCPIGTFSKQQGLSSQQQCSQCEHGKYCSELAATQSTDYCEAGYYCYSDSTNPITTSQPQNFICPAGSYCPSRSILPTKCPPGTYNPLTGQSSDSSCLQCPQGYLCASYGLSSLDQLQKCPLGFYCPGGAKGNSSLSSSLVICPAGYYCDQTSFTPQLCPRGTYNPMEGQSACLVCPAGYDCDGQGLTALVACPKGYYCTQGSLTLQQSNKYPCPAGTFSERTKLKTSSECEVCPVGRYCLEAEESLSNLGYCEAGYFCQGGSISPNSYTDLCPTGHYCEEGATHPSPCPTGTYRDSLGGTTESDCSSCPYTYYNDEIGQTSCTKKCDDGFVCLEGSNTPTPSNYTDPTMGRLCAVNHYCLEGEEFECPSGTFQNREGQSYCESCPLGYECEESSDPVLCRQGHYCQDGIATQCPDGTYALADVLGLESAEQCIPCPTGYYCVDATLDKDTQKCEIGYFCLSGAKASNDSDWLCPAGFYCDAEAIQMPIKCPNGTFSLAGASDLANCTECEAGYYCKDGSAEKIDCPYGYYCPLGTGDPIPCPKGTYGPKMNGKSENDCSVCPAGSLCNITGVVNTEDYLCPPGYYCLRGALTAIPCPIGTYRAVRGGSSLQTCSKCEGGFYCASEAQVVPLVCSNGTYCPRGSISPLGCPPGYYCPVKSASPIKCPSGFYCPGRSEYYFKCPNGTYCPEGTDKPIQCPGGTFGSGQAENGNFSTACDVCGRGQYSLVDKPGTCFECTPGYVCLGSTNTDKPISIEQHNGYICPPGHYCPESSYRELVCPIGTYNQLRGKAAITDCLPCKANTYNDLVGQVGCKQCGPSSIALEGQTTCECIGKNRRFIKSSGSCLCESGYKPKDGKEDADSVTDCEAIVQKVCEDGQNIDLEGNCIDSDEKICKAQCNNNYGTIIKGTGVCSCAKIVEPDQVCDAVCRSTQQKLTLDSEGKLTIEDPITKKVAKIDPSTVPGYIGDFKCFTGDDSSTCQVYSVGKSVDGDFTYDYSGDSKLIAKGNMTRSTTTKTSSKRNLQSQASVKITNPVMCIPYGSAVVFQVDSVMKSYPVYYKDSILNTNKDFDYAAFTSLATTINQGASTVTAFSYIFKDKGVYVFRDSVYEGKYTIIGVMGQNEQCSNADANVQMATAASLASIGIVSQTKTITPRWSFIVGVFIILLMFAFGLVGLIIFLHNRNSAQNMKSTLTNKQKTTIHYDKIGDLEASDQSKRKWYNCLCRRFKQIAGNKVVPSDDAEAITYKDLEQLLQEFRDSMEVLKQKMREDGDNDSDNEERKSQDGQDGKAQDLDEEDMLIQELNELRKFVNDNKECIEEFFNIQRDEERKEEDDILERSSLGQSRNDKRKEIEDLVREQEQQERKLSDKLRQEFEDQRKKLLAQIQNASEDERQRLIDEFKHKLDSQYLSDSEKEDLMGQLEHRIGRVNDILKSEEISQDRRLQEALEKRRKKKEGLTKVLEKLSDKRENNDQEFKQEMQKIKQQEEDELKRLDQDLEKEKAENLKKLEEDLKKSKNEKLADMEKKLEAMRKNSKAGDVDFGDLLNDYGKLVKKVECELELQKQKENDALEQRLKQRREQRKNEIENQRKDKEVSLDQQLNSKYKKLDDSIEQIKNLLKPVVNEEKRIQSLIENSDIIKPLVIDPNTAYNSNNIQPFQQQLSLVQEEEDGKIAKLMDDIKKQGDRSLKDHELQKSTILKKIEGTLDENERKKLLEQYERLKKNIDEKQEREVMEQTNKLKEALMNRRMRKQKIQDQMVEQQQKDILDDNEKQTKELIDKNISEVKDEEVKQLHNKLSEKFESDEIIQVAENFMDQKHMKELQVYMMALFEARAKGLRKYIFELMTQKQTELELIKEEFKPQYELLKDRKNKGQISDEFYREQMAKLTEEENERILDKEIQLKELEQKMEEDLLIQNIKGRSEVESALKDKQSQERVKLLEYLMDSHKDNDAIRQYLEKEKKDVLKELADFKTQKEQEKLQKIHEIEQMRLNRQRELKEKEHRMMNWEERMKQEEVKHMQAFEKQKNMILQKKLNEQKAELLREVNKDQIEKIMAQHKRDIEAIESALKREQERQMENMRKQVGEKIKDQESQKIKREIKMAQLVKDKQTLQKEIMNVSMGSTSGMFGKGTKEQEEWKVLKDKARMMMHTVDKKMYQGGTVFNKVAHAKKVELEKKLLKKDSDMIALHSVQDHLSSHNNFNSELKAHSQISDTESLAQDSVSTYNLMRANMTFKDLIDHVKRIEENYQQISSKLLRQ